jgi:phospholipid/cholesterol/gamma-HCH transport system permease protein
MLPSLIHFPSAKNHTMDFTNAEVVFDSAENQYRCQGAWTVLHLDGLYEHFVQASPIPHHQTITINGASLQALDSAGALALMNCMDELKRHDNQLELIHFAETQRQLLQLIESKKNSMSYQTPEPVVESFLYKLGKESENKLLQADGIIVLIGDLSTKIYNAFGYWKRFQVPSIMSNIDSAGIKALPIVALLSFLIGVVLAYQMGLQLQTYGANIFIAYLSGMAIFREFAPLITAIIVAGRTSSAFTAQIGSMKMNEEVDAILTMGLSPTELLVLPKVIGLVLIFPLLIFWADVFGIIGAMFMSQSMLHISFYDFLHRLRDAVGLKQMLLGLYKAPVFAILIALVGCFQGFQVNSSVANIGSQTTKSVVQALFLIIIADAFFSVVYSWMGL